MLKRLMWLLVLAVLAAACSAPEAAAPEAVATRRPTRTPLPESAEPTATSIVLATATSASSPTPAGTPTPDTTAQCPIDGLTDAAKPWLNRRPLLIKIDNSPLARPQSGITQADMVIEHYAEGGVTRFDAVFWCDDAATIGPIRSARIVDFDLTTMFQAILVHVGASNENLAALRQIFGNRLMDENVFKDPFHRIKERDAPYNTYTSTQGLWVVAPKQGITPTGVQLKGLTFSATAPAGGKPATHIDVPLDSRFSDSVWDYTAEQQTYRKTLLGKPLIDAAANNQQVQDANVVALFVPHTVTDIIEDSLGSRSIKIDIKGKGRVVIFRDGQEYEGQWLRDDPNGFIRFVDANGNDMPLKPGHSWWQIVPTDFKLTWK